jgi:hypothetical protein
VLLSQRQCVALELLDSEQLRAQQTMLAMVVPWRMRVFRMVNAAIALSLAEARAPAAESVKTCAGVINCLFMAAGMCVMTHKTDFHRAWNRPA